MIDRADDEIDALAESYARLDTEARDWWTESAPKGAEGMVDAEMEERER